jgi:hypothetical protein
MLSYGFMVTDIILPDKELAFLYFHVILQNVVWSIIWNDNSLITSSYKTIRDLMSFVFS